MSLKSICKTILLCGILCITVIKMGIRPYFHFSEPLQFVLGIAPNLIGSFLLPFGCYLLLYPRIDLHVDKQFKIFSLCCFGLLLFNETLQLLPVFGRTFDYYDIAASVGGLFLSYYYCSKYLFRKTATYP